MHKTAYKTVCEVELSLFDLFQSIHDLPVGGFRMLNVGAYYL